jgi:hypothetical protein
LQREEYKDRKRKGKRKRNFSATYNIKKKKRKRDTLSHVCKKERHTHSKCAQKCEKKE